jgi:hypothetical protein
MYSYVAFLNANITRKNLDMLTHVTCYIRKIFSMKATFTESVYIKFYKFKQKRIHY